MSKFAKKVKEETTEATPSPSKKEKLWTNDPALQEDGKTTEKGKAARKAKGLSVVPESALEKVPGFAKGAKKAKAEKASSKKGSSSGAEDTRKIKILSKENPYRAGTKAAATFDLLKASKTVAAFKAGLTEAHSAGYLNYAARDGYISVE